MYLWSFNILEKTISLDKTLHMHSGIVYVIVKLDAENIASSGSDKRIIIHNLMNLADENNIS